MEANLDGDDALDHVWQSGRVCGVQEVDINVGVVSHAYAVHNVRRGANVRQHAPNTDMVGNCTSLTVHLIQLCGLHQAINGALYRIHHIKNTN